MHMAENPMKKHAHGPKSTKSDAHAFAHVFYLVFSCACPCAHDMKCRVMCIPA